MINLLYRIYWFIQTLLGWTRTPDEGCVIRSPVEVDIDDPNENSVPLESIVAYVRTDDEAIYVVEGQEESVALHIKAEVNGNIWKYTEDGIPVKRERKVIEVSIHDFTMSIIRWIDFDGFKCLEVPAGTWQKIYNRKRGWNSWKYKVIMYFKTNETSNWCIKTRRNDLCRTVGGDYEGEYRVKRNGRWIIVRETHRLAACAG